MEKFSQFISQITEFIWGLPMMFLLLGGGVYLTFRLGFFQFRYFPHIIKETFGKIFAKSNAPGTVTPFQATASALASTMGAANIVGVPVAIALGGPGAIFWMWIVALIGMATKYSEVVLGIHYRQKNEQGEWVGGPMYYIEKGLGWKKVASFFAFALMIEIVASTMVQSNSIATTIKGSFGISPTITGIAIVILVSLVTYGGIKTIGKVSERLIPLMVVLYLLCSFIILAFNFSEIPAAFSLIFKHALTPLSAAGGFAGAGVAAAIRWGLARGLYSNEAGMGTAPIAHAAAMNDHPAKQGFWGIFEVIVDTLIVCTITALTVLTSGAWKTIEANEAPTMVAAAMKPVFGTSLSGVIVSTTLFLFVITTVVVIVFYGEKQAEYLFGSTFSKFMRFVYIGAIMIGAIGGLKFIWQFLDLMLACVVIPNIIAVFFLSGKVRSITNDYFSNFKSSKEEKENKKSTTAM
ncbi:sodium:alanine symporter family protein [Bacillus sp. DX1.1]|uniref:alanine/glycine:cation symporter family protein n=1 Tax=unclassified Bacillus (in: firmicutes) TaxID=185979 RepID=UPI00256FB9AD|nr:MULTISPECIES: sodium:alanine symporter family protein [unclassified Bacillus (in: firmicutes)]MDM5153090.1 sodium:alanine symporter family protein [Bacillus sp. DX1.1]MDM5186749.1 sodium:alanine symporter family protein [Bacillus sp. DX4.1]WJE82063.1 sodium:alanine symporter family protein [Bacillus sp. DX3.1]